MSRPSGRKKGQALAELALSMPLLMGVMVLVIEGTLLLSAQHSLTEAVHQVTRGACHQKLSKEQIRERVAAMCGNDPVIDAEAVQVEVAQGFDSNGASNMTVTARIPVKPVVFSRVGSFDLTASATYRIPKTQTPVTPPRP